MDRLPLETQTLYAELIDRLLIHEAHRTIGSVPGSFTTKSVKGRDYLYFQYADAGSTVRQIYLGALNEQLAEFERRYREALVSEADEAVSIGRLAAQLRAGGALTTDMPSARVLRGLADAGLFRLGGVLVGTHAFVALGNLLGVHWSGASLRTMDADLAATRVLDVAVPEMPTDVPGVLESLEMGFLPVPKLNHKEPSTSYKVRGQGLRVDLLTPSVRPKGPVPIHRLSAAAQPLKFLDFLMESPAQAAVVNCGATLVNVPDPARFSLHKLIIASERSSTEHVKRAKDLWQAGQVLRVLLDERPSDLWLALENLESRGPGWQRRLTSGIKQLSATEADVGARLVEMRAG